jgi:hypothetical protein
VRRFDHALRVPGEVADCAVDLSKCDSEMRARRQTSILSMLVRMLTGVVAAAPLLVAQSLPAFAAQGDTVRITWPIPATYARLANKTVKLFEHGPLAEGLMPIDVNHAAGDYPLEILDQNSRVLHTGNLRIERVDYPEQNIIVRPGTKRLEPSPGEMEAVSAVRNLVTEPRLWSEPFARPTPDCMNSPFGVRRLHNGVPTGTYHRGVDLRSPNGTEVRAIADGTVRMARMWNLHGGTVGIDHGEGVVSFYLHLLSFATSEGARARRGDVIGYVGSTGFATGPHLHWQLTVHGVPVNPHQWVAGMTPCPARTPAKRKPPRSKRTQRKR